MQYLKANNPFIECFCQSERKRNDFSNSCLCLARLFFLCVDGYLHLVTAVRSFTFLHELDFGRYTMERPRFSDHLEAIKFICKDFWFEIFKKQIDNLKTNHRVSFFHFPLLSYLILVYLNISCHTILSP